MKFVENRRNYSNVQLADSVQNNDSHLSPYSCFFLLEFRIEPFEKGQPECFQRELAFLIIVEMKYFEKVHFQYYIRGNLVILLLILYLLSIHLKHEAFMLTITSLTHFDFYIFTFFRPYSCPKLGQK